MKRSLREHNKVLGSPDGVLTAETLPFPSPLSVRIPTAIKMTGIGRSKLYELIRDGSIEVVKIGSATLIPVASLHRLLEKNKR